MISLHSKTSILSSPNLFLKTSISSTIQSPKTNHLSVFNPPTQPLFLQRIHFPPCHGSLLRTITPICSSIQPASTTPSSEENGHPLMVKLFTSIIAKSLSKSYRCYKSIHVTFEGKCKFLDELSFSIERDFLQEFDKVKISKLCDSGFNFNSTMVSTEDINLLIRFHRNESFTPNIYNSEFPNFIVIVIFSEAPVHYYPLYRAVSLSKTMTFDQICDLFCDMMLTDISSIASNITIIGIPLKWFFSLKFIKELQVLEPICWEKHDLKVVSKVCQLLDDSADDRTSFYYYGFVDQVIPGMTEEELRRARVAQRLIDTWTTSLLNARSGSTLTEVLWEGEEICSKNDGREADLEGNAIIHCNIPVDHLAPGVLFLNRNIVEIEVQLESAWEREGDELERTFNIELTATLKDTRSYGQVPKES
ncbi:hypothetical protein FRX31_011335 [Thalictrum thalictroides]|uniref:Uncharacterized protein n=1 Tax=Thalictrum thalictroides TaxID=46969 RepID=A0A7J6WQ42_THATH|nr:hypothetical protein FRX31_011335 [Thalictrum thalictroides]